jgi:PAS domain S-box-containing protein
MMKTGARDYLVKDVEFLQFVPEVVRHVLEQVETEHRLAAAEAQVNLIQSVVEQGFSAVLIASPDGDDPRVLYVNPAFSALTGHASGKVVGRPLSELPEWNAVRQRFGNGQPDEEDFVEHVSSYQSTGGERWVEWRVGPVKDKAGKTTHRLLILRDITERRRLEKEILEISDRVQRSIGQDLHDGLCQQLAGIELMSQALEQKIASRSRADAARIGAIAAHVRDAISQTRLLARGLSPVTLDSEGLMSALQELASNTEKIFGITCELECDAPVLVEDNALATHLFRIAQESVTNAIKHGKAKRVRIVLFEAGSRIGLRVIDNGSGFPASVPESGMGLRIMHSRAGMIGATLTVGNEPGGGARVECTVDRGPVSPRKEDERGSKKESRKSKKADSHR